MKTILTTLVAIALSAATLAQTESPEAPQATNDTTMVPKPEADDTTRIELKNAQITIVNKQKKSDDDDNTNSKNDKYELTWWNGVDIGVNGIVGDDYSTQLDGSFDYLEPEYGRSRYIAFNFGQLKGRIIKDYVGITTGLGFQIYNYKFDGETEFAFGDSLMGFATGEKNLDKNKLRVSYLTVPVLLEFNTSSNQRKSFHISAGVVGKVRIENMYKQKYSLDGEDYKTSQKGYLGLNRWAADATVRVGYRKLTVFGQVGLLPLFEDTDKNPDVYNFAVGLLIKV